jgi:hypothetical protein
LKKGHLSGLVEWGLGPQLPENTVVTDIELVTRLNADRSNPGEHFQESIPFILIRIVRAKPTYFHTAVRNTREILRS